MAIYHCSSTTISRGAGRSACAAAAYRAAAKITDERTGLTHDFTRKGGVLHSEIITPVESPTWATNRAKLWNCAEQAEDKSTRRATATTAREFIIALPHELDRDAQLAAAREFALYLVNTYGVTVDFSIHEPGKEGDKRNHHAHFMITDRIMTHDGFADKVRQLNIYNGGKANIALIRKQWAVIANLFLERAGVHEGIDHRSYKSQSLDLEATTHLGVAVTAMERRGEATERGDRNRAALEINTLRGEIEEVGETILALELAETYEGKEAAEIEVIEEADSAVTEKGTDMATIAGGIDPPDMAGCTTDPSRKAAALSEQHQLDQQKDTETPKPSKTKKTFDERAKEAEDKAKANQERDRLLELENPRQGHGRGR